MLLAIECLGLISILDKQCFINYAKIFTNILKQEVADETNLLRQQKDQVVALKSAVDGLIIHGICDEGTIELFDLITGEYLFVKDRVLRQVTIEGVCKMMFSPKLCDEQTD